MWWTAVRHQNARLSWWLTPHPSHPLHIIPRTLRPVRCSALSSQDGLRRYGAHRKLWYFQLISQNSTSCYHSRPAEDSRLCTTVPVFNCVCQVCCQFEVMCVALNVCWYANHNYLSSANTGCSMTARQRYNTPTLQHCNITMTVVLAVRLFCDTHDSDIKSTRIILVR